MLQLIPDAVTADNAAPAAAIHWCECSYLLLCMLLPAGVTAVKSAPAVAEAAAVVIPCVESSNKRL